MPEEDNDKKKKKKRPETPLERATRERDEWHDAWAQQRLATGRAYWDGYRTAIERVRLFLMPGNFPYTGDRKR